MARLSSVHSLLLLLSLFLLIAPTLSTPSYPTNKKGGHNKHDRYKTVKAHGSIQEAINKAKEGDTIYVEAGEYKEQLTIATSDLTLIGKKGAVLSPPGTPVANPCSGLVEINGTKVEVGICIHGKNVVLDAFSPALLHRPFKSVDRPIKNVVVSGFTVKNFLGANIAVLAGQNTHIKYNTLVDGTQYGFLTVGSKKTLAEHNVVTSSSILFIAMCMDDRAPAEFSNNDISNYFIALCTETHRGLVKKNTVKKCCIGPFVDPGIVGARILDNKIYDRNPGCPSGETGAGAGMVISGAKDTEVKGNYIRNIKNDGFGVGIFIEDNAETGKKATGNVIKGNTFKDNDFDVVVFATAPQIIRGNSCGSPAEDACQ